MDYFRVYVYFSWEYIGISAHVAFVPADDGRAYYLR